MLQTLFLIPHEVAGLPIFGVGWLLAALVVGLIVRLVWAQKQGQVAEVIAGEGLMWVIVTAAVVFLLPSVELKNLAGEPVGMAIRGYGVMLLSGVVAAVGLAAIRARNRGIDPDVIFSLALGYSWVESSSHKLFYVIQYRDRFVTDSIAQTIRNMLAFTEGGLVVYGSIIGGFIAGLIFVAQHRLPLLKLGDAIIPCIFLGIFLGRIGCLMNGCCYGGRCEAGWASIEFPATSPVYREQLESGELLGVKIDPVTKRVQEVAPGSLASQAGIVAGDRMTPIERIPPSKKTARMDIPADWVRTGVITSVNGKPYQWSPDQLPRRALPVQAVQVLSSVSSLVLCCLLCSLSYFVHRDGAVMMLGFAGYAVLRFVLELVRVDEGGQFGTDLSISQWVSICVLIGASAGLAWLYQQRPAAMVESSNS